jgi:hypothetical protein
MPFEQCMAHASFPERLSKHCQGLRCTFSEVCTKYDAHSLFLCRITTGQMHDWKKKGIKIACLPSCVKFCTPNPRVC